MPTVGVIMTIIMNEQGVQSVAIFDGVYDKVGISRTANGNDAIVKRRGRAFVAHQQAAKLLFPFAPVQSILLFVNSAARTDAIVIQG